MLCMVYNLILSGTNMEIGIMDFDHKSFKPVYYQIAEDLKKQISKGMLPDGGRLPTEEQLCIQFNVSRNTIRGALRKLENEGFLGRTRGKGTFVNAPKEKIRHLVIVSGLPPEGHRTIQELLAGAMGMAQAKGMRVSLVADSQLDELVESAKMSTEYKTCILFLRDKSLTPEKVSKVEKAGLPYLIEGDMHFPDSNYLDVDNRDAMKQVIDHLYGLGHRKIALYAISDRNNCHHDERVEAAIEHLSKLGIQHNTFIVRVAYESEIQVRSEAFRNCEKFFTDPSVSPTAIVCTSDTLAAMLLRWMNRNPAAVSHPVAVTGFDNREYCEFVDPPLSSVNLDYHRLGKEAVLLLSEMMDDFRGRRVQVRAKMNLILRESTEGVKI